MDAMKHKHVVEAMRHWYVLTAMRHKHGIEAMRHHNVSEAMKCKRSDGNETLAWWFMCVCDCVRVCVYQQRARGGTHR